MRQVVLEIRAAGLRKELTWNYPSEMIVIKRVQLTSERAMIKIWDREQLEWKDSIGNMTGPRKERETPWKLRKELH